MAPLPAITITSIRRLRASLSLLLTHDDVYAATSRLSDHPEIDSDEFRQAIRSAQLRLLRQRAVSRIRGLVSRQRSDSGADSPAPIEPSDAGLALALHLGLGLATEQLVELLGSTKAQLSRDLLNVRLRQLSKREHSCKIFLDSLGRYRDGLSDLSIAASLSQHRVRCASCHVLLQQFEDIDHQVLEQIQNAEQSAGVSASVRRSMSQRMTAAAPVALIVTALAVAILATAGLADSLIGGGATSLYAQADGAEPDEGGWILLGTRAGGLQAIDPKSGRRHTIREEIHDPHPNYGANYLVSPSGARVAIFGQNTMAGLHWATRRIQIVDLKGNLLNEIEWRHSVEAGWPTGWLNERELLISAIPAYESGETPERFLNRLEEEGSLRAVDVETGNQRVIYRGAVAQVIPSPDGERLAMVRPRNPREAGTTLDVWTVNDGEIGDLISTVEHRFTWTGDLQWSPSSNWLYLGYIGDYQESDEDGTAPSRDGGFRGRITRVDIMRIDREGNQKIFAYSEHNTAARIVAVFDDSREVIYELRSLTGGEEKELWHRDLASGASTALQMPGEANGLGVHHQRIESGILGYPSGFAIGPGSNGFMLMLRGDFYLEGDSNYHDVQPQATYLTTFDEERQASVTAVFSTRWEAQPLRWYSTDEMMIDQSSGTDHPAYSGSQDKVEKLRDYVRLGPDSVLSPDGSAIPLLEREPKTNRPYLWYPGVQTGRWIAHRTKDIAWFGDGHAVVGVTDLNSDGSIISRMTLHSSSRQGGSSVDAFLDPAGIKGREHLRYTRPAASPDGKRISFYVIDRERNRTDLWVAGLGQEARDVYRLRYSSRAERLAPLTGKWIDDHTFIFTEVIEWSSDGLPGISTLNRLTFDASGAPVIDRLLVADARGRDRGIAIREVAIDPNGDYIAYRQRHFTDRDDPSEGYDTIYLATTDDLGQALEIRRGNQNAGLVWDPGGRMLALVNDDRVAIYSVVDHAFQYVTGADRPAEYPNWVSSGELWFNVGSGSSRDVYRVMLD